jgi:hypothetical protein
MYLTDTRLLYQLESKSRDRVIASIDESKLKCIQILD